MDPGASAFLDLLDETVLNPSLWPKALAALEDQVRGFGAMLLSHSHGVGIRGPRLDPAVTALFINRFANLGSFRSGRYIHLD